MYENNYFYDEQSIQPSKKTKNNTVAVLITTVLIGVSSGLGGAYIQNKVAVQANEQNGVVSASYASESPSPSIISNETKLSSLLSSETVSGTLSTKQIVEKVSPSVVGVHAVSGGQSGTGTGIILSTDGYIITNAHVVKTETKEYVKNDSRNRGYSPFSGYNDDYSDIFGFFFGFGDSSGSYQSVTKNADKVSIVLSGNEDKEYEAEIIGADTNSDLAVLKIDATDLELKAAEFGDSNELTMGDTAIAIGYPLGMGLSASQGIISGLNRTFNVELSGGGSADMTLIQTDAAINPGNSGGPLINEYGQVIGITSSKLVNSSIEGMGFAIPITDAMPLISDLMSKGYVSNDTPQIGITGSDINAAIMRYYSLPVDKGVMVVAVDEESGANLAGISAGDVIIAADGKDISSMKELTAAKKGKKVGDVLTLTLARSDENIDIDVVLS